MFNTKKNRLAAAVSAATVSALLPWTVQAQGTTGDANADEVVEEVVVTGTRIQRAVDEQIKIDTIGAERIEVRGYTNIIQGITELPITGGNITNEGANTQFGDNSAFPNLLNLGTNRTLTLVNGRRFVSSNQATVFVPGNDNGAQVDVSIYNPALLERTEILTVGGGPIYGADAVAGVVNLILKDDYEGLNITAQGGITELGDGENGRLSVLWGENFMDGRANVTIGAEYFNSALVDADPNTGGRRNIDAAAEEFLTPAGFPDVSSSIVRTGVVDPRFVQGGVMANVSAGGGGQARQIVSNSFRENPNFRGFNPNALIGSSGGGVNTLVIPNGNAFEVSQGLGQLAVPLRFTPDGNLVPFAFGDVVNQPGEVSGTVGGDGLPNGFATNIRSAQERTAFNFLGRFDINDNLTIKQELLYSKIRNESQDGFISNAGFGGSNSAGSFSIPVYIDENPFFGSQAQGVIADLVDLGLDVDTIGDSRALYLNRELSDVTGEIISGNESETFRSVTVLEGNFEFLNRDFQWDTAFIYGKNESDNFDTNLLDVEFALATDVVVDPATGQPACRQQVFGAEAINLRAPRLANINTGLDSLVPTQAQIDSCVPLNLIGYGNASQAARDYVVAGSDSFNESEQIVWNASLSGKIIDLPGGEMLFGLQVETREESNRFVPGPVFGQGLARNTKGNGSDGTLEFLEYGSEFIIPITGGDFTFFGFDSLEANAAIRRVERDISSPGNPFTAAADTVGANSWTIGGRWTPFEEAGLTFRGNRTVAVRSPSVVELAGAGVTGFTGGGDADFACDADNIDAGPDPVTRRANCESAYALIGQSAALPGLQIPNGGSRPAAGGANAGLANEESNSWTAGFAWQPEYIPGLTVEADYFEIELENQIALSFQVNSCYDDPNFPNSVVGGYNTCEAGLFEVQAGGPFAPNADPSLGTVIPEINPLTGNAVPAIANPGSPGDNQELTRLGFIFFPTLNVGTERLEAWSTRVNYNFDTSLGVFDVDWNGYFLESRILCPTGDCNAFENPQEGEDGNPEYAHTMFFTHVLGDFSHQIQWIHAKETVDNVNAANPATQAFDFVQKDTNRFNYSVAYDINENITARLIVDNITDFRLFETTDTLGFDPLGRRFTLQVNANW